MEQDHKQSVLSGKYIFITFLLPNLLHTFGKWDIHVKGNQRIFRFIVIAMQGQKPLCFNSEEIWKTKISGV